MSPILMFLQQAAAPAASGAAPPGAGGGMDMFSLLIMPLGMLAIFYFLLIRPQNNRMKKHKELLAALKKGDLVITNGGIIGRIFKLADDEITLDTGEGGKLRVARHAIGGLYGTTSAPAPANDAKGS
jgi:preprotein translocase subunit YajC